METNWNIIAEKNPQGYVELNSGREAIYGPIDTVNVTGEDWVELKVKWVIKRQLGDMGIPISEWQVVSNMPTNIAEFPNHMVPFEIEETPNKGLRARFGLNIIYFDPVEKVDPSKVNGLQLATT